MERELIIYGAGGAGRELAFSLSLEKNATKTWNLKGFVDDNMEFYGKIINGLPVLGNTEWLKENGGSVAITTVGSPLVKREVVQKLKERATIDFPKIVGPNCIISDLAEFGEGCIISLAFNWVSPNVKMGKFVFVNCTTRIGHDAIIGDYSTVFSGIDISGGVQIGPDCIIGSGVTINPLIKIGEGSIIGAGSVVTKDIPSHVIAAGAPAKVIREIRS
ncbi:MAG: NeuD/PglB/VioB family sugar acetyltransferase [Candidatus Vecturithrix sp.]|jgi:sugar O-acyltransferase (sialic acid O-acetyltransferase NeuD family)|nr:NeuD/PglB/VioB family sugar acetyltransferase [Candidatus Vecturithrix sp.]